MAARRTSRRPRLQRPAACFAVTEPTTRPRNATPARRALWEAPQDVAAAPPALLAHQAPAARTFVCCCDEPSPSQEPAKPYEAVLPDSGYGWTNPRSARTRPVRRPAKVGFRDDDCRPTSSR